MLRKSSGKTVSDRKASAGVVPVATFGSIRSTARINATEPLDCAAIGHASTIETPAEINASRAAQSRARARFLRPLPRKGTGPKKRSIKPRQAFVRVLLVARTRRYRAK